ncbi:MAG TPA: sulfate reduction electron transfer complex DsrMKJOP subunit DsrM [Candidatus Acidoferrum sp.]|nr:sulfate reduction electron transfer complex DsrMKJOP subunit DsrM [Candidatus Methylomirabilis sp.]HWU38109.1 sulfate reduction electron transfer complex DsrMKJOP subunit DsrM [Candidatus Acidoferrum sp.]
MDVLYSLVLVLLLAGLAFVGGQVDSLRMVFGAVVPGVAIVVFLLGLIYRIALWARTPVPFRITTTCGQERSLPWIKANRLENPATTLAVVGRMALEVGLFRSLFRNTKAELRDGPRLVYSEDKFLWLAALAFHWSFLVIFLRHLRFFLEPVPAFVNGLSNADGFFQVGAPVLLVTDIIVLGGLGYLLLRRLRNPQVRYVSLFADYFALFLLLGLVISGIFMRYFTRIDTVAVKQLAMGLVTFSPVIPKEVGPLFFVHLFLLSLLAAYFPFSKLMHMGGIFLSPTRNLANNNRMERHINPWNHPVKVHTYQEWEEEFRDKMKAAGLPLEKE